MTERGTLLGGRYELDQIIGRGGMAEVWKAKDTRLGRDVAVKRLRVDLASDSTFQARFRREAQAAAGLNHPNIVSVYDTGEEIDSKSDVHVPFIIMELVDGVTLREVLRGGRKILPERALEFTQGTLDALAYSHRAGIVHRDIKPANVMLTATGTVKVMDFGIARAVADTSATMTQTAAVIGTAQYLSPEQARGEKVDNRSDIYSTGVLLYELLVGRPPFIGDSPVSVAYQHVREMPVPPSALDSEITPAMDAIVLKALAKDPADRYQDARAMRDDITRCLNNSPVAAAMQAPGGEQNITSVVPQVPTSQRTTVVPQVPPVQAAGGIGGFPEPDLQSEPEPEKKRKPPVVAIVIGSLVALLTIAVIVALFVLNQPSAKPAPTIPVATTTAPVTTTTAPTPSVAKKQVPSVVGFSVEQAKSTLLNAGFNPIVEPGASEKPKDEVIKQTPAARGQAPEGADVTIVVSLGPAPTPTAVTVPDLVGKSKDDAIAALTSAQVPFEVKDADPKTEPISATAGNVTSISPPAGVQITSGRKVTVYIATGKSIVPNFLGKSQEEVTKIAANSGFTIKLVSGDPHPAGTPAGQIYRQDATDGVAMPRGTVITLTFYADR